MLRHQIAAANWKMNLSLKQALVLVEDIRRYHMQPAIHQQVILGVPFPYLIPIQEATRDMPHVHVAAQNCASTPNGAYTGEVSAEMLQSLNIPYVILGHSERRTYFHETSEVLVRKVNQALAHQLKPIFCCGEPLDIREAGTQNAFVEQQLKEALFHIPVDHMRHFIIAYEPIWAIGTGKTASSEQAQDMHRHIRQVLSAHYGPSIAETVSILYGGSVKGSNAGELFGKPDVDGGLVGGASLVAAEFSEISLSLKPLVL